MPLRRFFRCRWWLLGVLCCSGCLHLPAAGDYPGPTDPPPEIAAYYKRPSWDGRSSVTLLHEDSSYKLLRVDIMVDGDRPVESKRRLRIDYYLPRRSGQRPVILLLPILRGTVSVVRYFAEYFAGHGFAVVLTHRQRQLYEVEQPAEVEANLRQMVIDHRLVLDWIETRPELDGERIGVFGISMGGIKAALLSAVDRRIKGSVIALAAGDIPHILTYSTEPRVSRIRARFLQESGRSRVELYRSLQNAIRSDPLLLAGLIDARRSLMILALFDSVVSFGKGEELRRRIGRPETIYLFTGHFTSVLFKSYVAFQARLFLARQLAVTDR